MTTFFAAAFFVAGFFVAGFAAFFPGAFAADFTAGFIADFVADLAAAAATRILAGSPITATRTHRTCGRPSESSFHDVPPSADA